MATEKVWEQKEGTWSLRKNPNRAKNEKAPDFIGSICINGTTYDLSAWQKVSASGNHWLSGTVKPPFASSQGAAPPRDIVAHFPPFDDVDKTIPF